MPVLLKAGASRCEEGREGGVYERLFHTILRLGDRRKKRIAGRIKQLARPGVGVLLQALAAHGEAAHAGQVREARAAVPDLLRECHGSAAQAALDVRREGQQRREGAGGAQGRDGPQALRASRGAQAAGDVD